MTKTLYKLKDIFNINNIKSFIEGHANYFWDKWDLLAPHIKEQVKYRLENCKEDCVPKGKCIKCGCPTHVKVFASKSCNIDRHPDMMNNEEWEQFKKNEENLQNSKD